MALRKIHIEKLGVQIAGYFSQKGELKESLEQACARIALLLTQNMEMERSLDAEAQKLLDSHRKQMGMGFDEQKAFMMIKKQLAKQKGFVL